MIDILKWIHIVGGGLLLGLGLVQLILPKHGKRHRNLGLIYVQTMIIVCVTALYISSHRMMNGFNFGSLFLFSIGLFSLYGVVSGYLLGKFKTRRNVFLGKAVVVYGVLTSAVLLTIAFKFWSAVGPICLVFGVFQVMGTVRDLVYYYMPDRAVKRGGLYWLFEHSGRMMGSYIACVTAFLVNVVQCPYPIVLWLGPTVIGTSLIFLFNAQLNKKYKTS
jgi:uncharacterized membrane protein